MTEHQRETFLAEPHVGVLAVAREEGPPLAVPIWYAYEPGGEIVVQMVDGCLKHRLIQKSGSFALLAQDEEPPYRYVSTDGPVVEVHTGISLHDAESFASRYLHGDALKSYLASIDPDEIVEMRMRPVHWYAVDEA